MTLRQAITAFGIEAKSKLSNPAASGAPEDQLRAPLEVLISRMAEISGLRPDTVGVVGEASLADLKTRPDYAVTRGNALIGFIEVKAPGKGADPRRFRDRHDKQQWTKLQSLPNLIYTDGNAFSLWRNGVLTGQVIQLEGDIEHAGRSLTAPDTLASLFSDFFLWEPIPPRSATELASTAARLCRLLREEVIEQMALGSESLTHLATDWRKLLFPEATDAAFADGYAQAVTFGLLMARARNIDLSDGLDRVARELRETNTLIGAALRLLTDDADSETTLKTSLATLTRVLDAVHWPTISGDNPEAWLYFYEDFLSIYDNDLRKRTGSYYTPPRVVQTMVRLVDEALRSERRFDLSEGLASSEVTIADPAIGTGTFLLGVFSRIAEATSADQGLGAVPGIIEAAIPRLIGFELQFGPFAVAQLRLLAELQTLLGNPSRVPAMRLFVTDTLGNPYAEEEYLPHILMPIGESRRQANQIKRQEKITVVIGNPPYKEKAKGSGGWIESGSLGEEGETPLGQWMPPTEWNVSAHSKHLRNLYVYFWRWATWKVFGDSDGEPIEGRSRDHRGIICFITVAGFLNGPGFQKMRADLRRDADEIWIIDCSPEGHQPPVPTRIFQGVQHPVCIVMAVRSTNAGSEAAAQVRYRVLPQGDRDSKFAALRGVALDDDGWTECPSDPRAPFFPRSAGAWVEFAPIQDLFEYNGSGVMPGRTWVIAPDRASLEKRWKALQAERDRARKEALFHPHLRNGKPGDRHLHKPLGDGLRGHEFRSQPVAKDTKSIIRPVRYGFRSFDQQWIIPDKRLINQANPTLWENHAGGQVYMTTLLDHAPSGGPAVTFSATIPDLHHYNGRGGRVFPLWADRKHQTPNLKAGLLREATNSLGVTVCAPDMMAYFAAVAAHPAYTAQFQADLVQPGLRFPLTAEAGLWAEAVKLGREIIWLHCFGQRYADVAAGRRKSAPRMPAGQRPVIPGAGAIPTNPDRFPNRIEYNAGARRLNVGSGFIDNVQPAMWKYEVSGKQVLPQWFSYRRRDRSRPIIGDRRPPSALEKIQPEGWLPEYTTDLMDILHVLGRLVALEPRQADLLSRICGGPLLSTDELRSSGAFDSSRPARRMSTDERQTELLDESTLEQADETPE